MLLKKKIIENEKFWQENKNDVLLFSCLKAKVNFVRFYQVFTIPRCFLFYLLFLKWSKKDDPKLNGVFNEMFTLYSSTHIQTVFYKILNLAIESLFYSSFR